MGYGLECCVETFKNECIRYSPDCLDLANKNREEFAQGVMWFFVGIFILVLIVIIAICISDYINEKHREDERGVK